MELNFQLTGEGAPVILLHGLLGSLQNWFTIAKRLAQNGCRVFSLDLRNHGASPHSERMDFPRMADDLSEFIETNHIELPVLVGHSLGGKVAMSAALGHAALIRGLVGLDIGTRAYAPRHEDIFQALESVDLTAMNSREAMDAELAKRLDDPRLRQFLLTNAVREASGNFRWRMNLPALRDNYGSLREAVSGPKPYGGPALFVRGGRSDYLVESDLPEIQRLFPAGRMVAIETASHWIQADEPEALLRILLDFIGSITAGINASGSIN